VSRCRCNSSCVWDALTMLECCAGDETLRFWNVFPGAKSQGTAGSDSSVGSMMRTQIR